MSEGHRFGPVLLPLPAPHQRADGLWSGVSDVSGAKLRLHKGDILLWWSFGLSGTHAYSDIFTHFAITRKI